jgi:PAS domain S-box-containing protein
VALAKTRRRIKSDSPLYLCPFVRRGHLTALLALLGALGWWTPARSATTDDPEYLIEAWETEQGLPEDSATAMVQTPDGYLWFGTFNGLVRFDGVKFTVFDRSNTPELPSPGIVNLHLDRSGRLWVSTMLGMAAVKDGRWASFGQDSGWIGNYVRFFAEDAGQLYMTTFDGKVLRARGDRFEELSPPPAHPLLGFVPYVDEAGAFWVVNPQFIGKLVDGRWQETIPVAPLFEKGEKEKLIMAGTSRDGALWLATSRFLRKYRAGRVISESPTPWPLQGLWSLHEDAAGAVWICTHNSGVYRFTSDGRWRHFTTGSGLSYHAARFVFEDREGSHWIGTSGGGLNRFKRRNFMTWGLAQGLPERVVKTVSADAQGRIVMGTHGQGLARLEVGRITRLPCPKQPDVSPLVLSTLVDRQGRIWSGSLANGLHRADGATCREFFVGQVAGATGMTGYSLFEDSQGRIWMGLADGDPRTHEGATSFSGETFRTYRLEGSPALNSVRCFAEDPRDGAIWAGTNARGLYRLEGERFVPVLPDVLADERISSLLADGDGTLWIGTEDHGIASLRDGRLTIISEGQGLPARSIASILDDGLGNLWLGTNRGILRIPRPELEAVIGGRKTALASQVFNLSDGLASIECQGSYQPTAVKDRDGTLWFATFKGVVSVDPKALLLNTQPPPVVIEELLIDGERLGVRERFATSGSQPLAVTVPKGAKRLEIHYTGLSFTAPEKVRFRYMLDGLDSDWIDVGDRRVAYLQDLSPGRYRVRVKAANNDGVWNENGSALELVVQASLWQTLWFRLLVLAMLLGGVGFVAVRATRNTLRWQIERLEQRRALEQERARLASVLETTSDYVGFADIRGNVLYLNPAGRRLLGLSQTEDVRQRTIADFHPPWATERILKEGIFCAIRDGTWSSETALRGPDGREIPLSQVIVAHWSADGTVDVVSTIARDISEQKRAEEALREAEEKYREIFVNAVEGIFQSTPAGRFLAANPAQARMLGYGSPEELLAEVANIEEQLYVDPTRRREMRRLLEVEGVVRGFECELRRRDGTLIWVSESVRTVRDDTGQTLYYEGTSEDISDRRRAQQAASTLRAALEKAAKEWELTFDAMESPVLILDGRGRIARLNRAARALAARLQKRDVVGLAVKDVGPEQPWRMASEMAEQVAAARSAVQRQGSDALSGRTWDVVAGPSPGHGDEERVIVVARDVTRMVELQDSLRRSETMSAMGMLVAGVAHEVRNPLFSISANLDAFDAKTGSRPEFKTFVTLMRAEVERLAGLMKELLDYGKPVQAALAPESIDPVIREAMERCAPLAARVGVELVSHVTSSLPTVPVDRRRLVQVFQNLLQNAIEHSQAGGVVAVAATKEQNESGAWVVATVTDSGPGFQQEDLARIFMPFFSKRRGGTGLGLAIAQRIVEAHGGQVWGVNRPEGGAALTVKLPCAGARERDDAADEVASGRK